MKIVSLSPALGAEVTGLSVAALTPTMGAELLEAFLEHHLLCFRTSPLTDTEFAELSRNFGAPQLQLIRSKRSDTVPEVSVLESTYKTADAKPKYLKQVRLSGWHTDDSYFAKPSKATMLQGLDIPSSGGQTKFCNTRLAWDELPERKKADLVGLKAVHRYDTARAVARPERRTAEEANETPEVVHPLVRTHEDTGRKAIYFNPNRTDRVVGYEQAASDALLDELYQHITQGRYQYHHQWQVGDILLWDNRCLVHAVNTDFPVGERRRHQRILLEGTTPA